MLNLAVLNVGCPRIETHETALQLLHLLDTRFFQEQPIFSLSESPEELHRQPLNDVLLSVSYCHSQVYLSEQLARLHPDLTMPMFSGKSLNDVLLSVTYCHFRVYLSEQLARLPHDLTMPMFSGKWYIHRYSTNPPPSFL